MKQSLVVVQVVVQVVVLTKLLNPTTYLQMRLSRCRQEQILRGVEQVGPEWPEYDDSVNHVLFDKST